MIKATLRSAPAGSTHDIERALPPCLPRFVDVLGLGPRISASIPNCRGTCYSSALT